MGWFCDHILDTTGVFSHLKVSVALQWKIERTYCIKKFFENLLPLCHPPLETPLFKGLSGWW